MGHVVPDYYEVYPVVTCVTQNKKLHSFKKMLNLEMGIVVVFSEFMFDMGTSNPCVNLNDSGIKHSLMYDKVSI